MIISERPAEIGDYAVAGAPGISVALSSGDGQGDGGFDVWRQVSDHGPEKPHARSFQGNHRLLLWLAIGALSLVERAACGTTLQVEKAAR